MPNTQKLRADQAGINQAGALLRAGGLVAFPTESVYGLGADARDDRAVASVFAAKGRPEFNPLIVHLADADQIGDVAVMTDAAADLAAAFWPGPLTLVLPLAQGSGISKLVTAGLNTIAVRVPAHPTARALLRSVGGPIAAPSANLSGRISPTTADHVLAGLDGAIDAVLDDGPCAVGVESTIVDATNSLRLLRPGGVSQEDIEAVTGPLVANPVTDDVAPTAPGQLASHYAPRVSVRLNATHADPGETLIGFGFAPRAALNLSPNADLIEAAANLFAMLHSADEIGHPIAVAPIPGTGIGRAINDRLRRAASPRP